MIKTNCKKCICRKCISTCRCHNCTEPVTECDNKQEFKQISLFTKPRLVRFFTWDDYGISKSRYTELQELCRSGQYDDLARSAAYSANKDIAEYILLSVRKNISFEGVEYAEGLGRIPCGRTDFYGYRRLFYHYFDTAIKMVQNPLSSMR